MENQEKLFTKGFNSGYLIAKHEPELAEKLVINKNDNNEYFKGIVSGKKEHDIEKKRLHLKAVSKGNTPIKEISKDKGRGR